MKQLFIKELFSYFKSKIFYAMMAIYIVISMVCCFYLGRFFDIATNNLFSLFYFQPNILAFVIPAIAVKLWSEERRSNTIELLSSLPISYLDVVFAKFLAVACIGLFMLLLTLPFFVFAAFGINLDYLSVFSSYFAVMLVVFLTSALSCAVSCFFISPAVAYLMSLFVIWLVYLLGFYNNFTEILYGYVGLNNVFYFLFIIFASLNINLYLFKHKFIKTKKLLYNSALQIFSAGILIFIFSVLFSQYRFDISYSKDFSLSDDAYKVLSSYKEPVIIDFYYSDFSKTDPKKAEYIKNVRRFIKKIPNSVVNVNKINPFSKEEGMAIDFNFDVVETPKYNLYAGIVFSAGKNRNIINSLNPLDVNFLEADIVRVISSLHNKDRKTIGILAGRPSVLQKKYGIVKGKDWPFVEEVKKYYNVFSLSEKTFEIPAGIDILLVLHQPKSFLLKYAIDQYLMRGGKVLILENDIEFSYNNKTNFGDDVVSYQGELYSDFDNNIVEDVDVSNNMLPFIKKSVGMPTLIEINKNVIGNKDAFVKDDFELLLKNLEILSQDKTLKNIGKKNNVVIANSIKDKVENFVSKKYLQKASDIASEVDILKDKILKAEVFEDMDVKEFQKVTKLQEDMQKKQDQAKEISYLVEEETKIIIMGYMLLNIVLFPFFLMVIMRVVFEVLRRRYVKI